MENTHENHNTRGEFLCVARRKEQKHKNIKQMKRKLIACRARHAHNLLFFRSDIMKEEWEHLTIECVE